MARWPVGDAAVDFLIERGRLERLEGEDRDLVELTEVQLQRSALRLRTARAALELGDVDGAYVAAYDAYRMAADALLVRQGLHATGGDGSHMTVEDAVGAQFSADIPAFAKPVFEQMRGTRHTAQYVTPSAPPIEADDAAWALSKAEEARAGVESLVATSPPGRF